jgi:hypothetical protein
MKSSRNAFLLMGNQCQRIQESFQLISQTQQEEDFANSACREMKLLANGTRVSCSALGARTATES